MSITPSGYVKARSETLSLFGWSADSLLPDQTLRIDCAVALRLALDDLQGRIVRGESADVARMLTASRSPGPPLAACRLGRAAGRGARRSEAGDVGNLPANARAW
jgi:hypothetical protein